MMEEVVASELDRCLLVYLVEDGIAASSDTEQRGCLNICSPGMLVPSKANIILSSLLNRVHILLD